jgi:hypothetical protein
VPDEAFHTARSTFFWSFLYGNEATAAARACFVTSQTTKQEETPTHSHSSSKAAEAASKRELVVVFILFSFIKQLLQLASFHRFWLFVPRWCSGCGARQCPVLAQQFPTLFLEFLFLFYLRGKAPPPQRTERQRFSFPLLLFFIFIFTL